MLLISGLKIIAGEGTVISSLAVNLLEISFQVFRHQSCVFSISERVNQLTSCFEGYAKN